MKIGDVWYVKYNNKTSCFNNNESFNYLYHLVKNQFNEIENIILYNKY